MLVGTLSVLVSLLAMFYWLTLRAVLLDRALLGHDGARLDGDGVQQLRAEQRHDDECRLKDVFAYLPFNFSCVIRFRHGAKCANNGSVTVSLRLNSSVLSIPSHQIPRCLGEGKDHTAFDLPTDDRSHSPAKYAFSTPMSLIALFVQTWKDMSDAAALQPLLSLKLIPLAIRLYSTRNRYDSSFEHRGHSLRVEGD